MLVSRMARMEASCSTVGEASGAVSMEAPGQGCRRWRHGADAACVKLIVTFGWATPASDWALESGVLQLAQYTLDARGLKRDRFFVYVVLHCHVRIPLPRLHSTLAFVRSEALRICCLFLGPVAVRQVLDDWPAGGGAGNGAAAAGGGEPDRTRHQGPRDLPRHQHRLQPRETPERGHRGAHQVAAEHPGQGPCPFVGSS